MPAFSIGTALTIGALAAGGTAAVTHAVRKRKARQAAAASPETVLGPPPTAPASALQNESASIASARIAGDAQRRRAARPVNAVTRAPARGAQAAIKRAPLRPAFGGAY